MTFNGRDGRAWSFDETDRLGEPGGFGEVLRRRGPGGARVAIKRVRLRRDDEADRRRRDREVEIADLIAAAAASSTCLRRSTSGPPATTCSWFFRSPTNRCAPPSTTADSTSCRSWTRSTTSRAVSSS
jgi:hypothetical protein